MNTRKQPVVGPADVEVPVSDAVRAELLRRRAEYARDGKPGRPWPEVLAEQRRKVVGPR